MFLSFCFGSQLLSSLVTLVLCRQQLHNRDQCSRKCSRMEKKDDSFFMGMKQRGQQSQAAGTVVLLRSRIRLEHTVQSLLPSDIFCRINYWSFVEIN